MRGILHFFSVTAKNVSKLLYMQSYKLVISRIFSVWVRRQKLIVKQWVSNDTQRIVLIDQKMTQRSKEEEKDVEGK